MPAVSRLLFVHAHPDDETMNNGVTIARYIAAGAEVSVLTCTLGEEGALVIGLLGYLLYKNWALTLVFLAIAPLIVGIDTAMTDLFKSTASRGQREFYDDVVLVGPDRRVVGPGRNQPPAPGDEVPPLARRSAC
jgi:ABC-type multidrug transport system fused ATPase/permease subunit